MRYKELIETKIFPLSKYNQDVGNLDWIVIQIERQIEQYGDNLNELIQKIDLNKVKASQDWLSTEGGGDPVFPDIPEDYWDYPVIAKVRDELVIIDGHHRMNKGDDEALVFPITVKENNQ